MLCTNPLRILFVVVALTSTSAFAQDFLIRDSDLLHFDVREYVNFSNQTAALKVSTELCGAMKLEDGKVSNRIFCQSLDEVAPTAIPGKPEEQKFSILKFEKGNQSQRRKGTEINAIAKSILGAIGASGESSKTVQLENVEFRIAVKFFEVVGESSQILDTAFSNIPHLETLAPETERGLLINRFEILNANRTLKTRTLVVITRRGERS